MEVVKIKEDFFVMHKGEYMRTDLSIKTGEVKTFWVKSPEAANCFQTEESARSSKVFYLDSLRDYSSSCHNCGHYEHGHCIDNCPQDE